MLLVHYIYMSVVDAFMSKLYFKNDYFCEEIFVVEAFDNFKISKKQNQQNVYCGGFFIQLLRHRFELDFRVLVVNAK